MQIMLAKTAGFCFGVGNAVKKAFAATSDNNYNTYTLGELIHNPQVVKQLEASGVSIVNSVSQIQAPANVIIRAHGIGYKVYKELQKKGVCIYDATCPYVKRIHKLVSKKYKEGCQIIIVGNKNHPEVIGIDGWCENTAFIVESKAEVERLSDTGKRVCVVAQTTITREKWQEIIDLVNKKFANVIKFDTICSATVERQIEAEEISRQADMMVVIGGKNSSNTQKLFEICRLNCRNAIMVESAEELPLLNRFNIKTIGITAGASTPDWVIKEVYSKMSEMLDKQQSIVVQENESVDNEGKTDLVQQEYEAASTSDETSVQNSLDAKPSESSVLAEETEIEDKKQQEKTFEEAFEEEAMVRIRTGQIIKGRIIGYNTSEVFVDLGYKSDGTISMEEFLDDPDFDPVKDLVEGEEIEVFVQKINDGEGNVKLSKKKVDAIRGLEYLGKAYKTGEPIEVLIKEAVKGGVVSDFKGTRIFIPASQISDRYVKDLEEFVGKKLKVVVTEFVRGKKRVIASRKAVIEKEKEERIRKFWDSVEVGKEYTGTVRNITKFGAFVDLGGVDGLVHISELSWSKVDHPSDILKTGDEVKVRILSFDKENQKISLGYRRIEDNPWYKIDEKYQVGDVVKGKVLRLVPFGVFVELEPGVEGLVHISQISDVRLAKPDDVLSVGQEAEMKVIEVNPELKKISLSIKEVNPINPAVEEKKDSQAADAFIPSEHKEEMINTIGEKFENLKLE